MRLSSKGRWRKLPYSTWKFYSPRGTVTLSKVQNSASLINLSVTIKRQGYGTYLVNEAKRKAVRMKLQWLRVRVMETTEARLFWRKFGIANYGNLYLNDVV